MKAYIRIGDTVYRIRKVSHLPDEDLVPFQPQNKQKQKELMGEIDYDKKLIRINNKKPRRYDTLYHEIAHGILSDLEDKSTSRIERFVLKQLNNREKFIDLMGNTLRTAFTIRGIKEKEK